MGTLRLHCIAGLIAAAAAPTATRAEPAEKDSCPAFAHGSLFETYLPEARADRLKLFARSSKDKWRQLPMQVDPLDEEGVLRDNVAKHRPWKTSDRFSFLPGQFGPRIENESRLPCEAKLAVEVQHDSEDGSRYAYLTRCPKEDGNALHEPMHHDGKKRIISSSFFRYHYRPDNQLIFQDLTVTPPGSDKTYRAGGDAGIRLHLDPKHFFDIDLTTENLHATVDAERNGPIGFLDRVRFTLNILFLELDMHMATVGSFFPRGANIPMMIDVPRDSTDSVNPGSGFAFHWRLQDSKLEPATSDYGMPTPDKKAIQAGWKHWAKTGLKRCRDSVCPFRLRGSVGDAPYTIDITVPRHLVERGFFPTFVGDYDQFVERMDWDSEIPKTEDRVALYFETSGLKKGRYQISYWIRLRKPEETKIASCPQSIQVTRKLGPETAKPPATAH